MMDQYGYLRTLISSCYQLFNPFAPSSTIEYRGTSNEPVSKHLFCTTCKAILRVMRGRRYPRGIERFDVCSATIIVCVAYRITLSKPYFNLTGLGNPSSMLPHRLPWSLLRNVTVSFLSWKQPLVDIQTSCNSIHHPEAGLQRSFFRTRAANKYITSSSEQSSHSHAAPSFPS